MRRAILVAILFFVLVFNDFSLWAEEGDDSASLRAQVKDLVLAGDWIKAESFLKEAHKSHPEVIDFSLRLAEVLSYQGKTEEARKTLAQTATRYPDQNIIFYRLALLPASQGKTEETLKQLEDLKSSGKLPKDVRPDFDLTLTLEKSGHDLKALAFLCSYKATPDSKMFLQAKDRLVAKKWQESTSLKAGTEEEKLLKLHRSLLQSCPFNWKLLQLFEENTDLNEDYHKKLLSEYKSVFDTRTKKLDSPSAMAAAFGFLVFGDKDQAARIVSETENPDLQSSARIRSLMALSEGNVSKAVKLAGTDENALLLLARSAERRKTCEASLEILKKLMKLYPESRQGHFMMAHVYNRCLSLEPDDGWINETAEMFPQDADMLKALGEIYFMRMRNSEALPFLKKAMKLAPQSPNLLGTIAAAYHDLKDKDAVIKDLEKRHKKDPQDPALSVAIGVISYYDGFYEKALSFLEPLQKEFPDEPRLYIYPMMSYFYLGKQEKALKYLERTLQFEDDSDVHYCAAVIHKKDNPTRSLEELDIFLEMNEDIPQRYAPKLDRVRKMRQELVDELSGKIPRSDDFRTSADEGGAKGPTKLDLFVFLALAVLVSGIYIYRRKKKARAS